MTVMTEKCYLSENRRTRLARPELRKALALIDFVNQVNVAEYYAVNSVLMLQRRLDVQWSIC